MSANIKKIASLSLLCLGISASSFAQTNALKAANDYYSKGEFYKAAQLYEQALGAQPSTKSSFNPYSNQRPKGVQVGTSNKAETQLKLAESYFNLRNYQKAESLLKELSTSGNAQATLLYAQALKFNGKVDEATAVLNGIANADAQKELASVKFAKDQYSRKDLSRYNVSKIGGLNAEGATYAPALSAGQLVVTSTRADNNYSAKKANTNKLYSVANNQATLISGLSADANMEQGIASFSPDGNTMYLTKWAIVNGAKKAGIYKSTKNGNNWSTPVLLSDAVNASGSTARQPHVTADGKYLLFSSDRAGGKGKNDIWYIGLDASGNPTGTATNLSAVNTAGDDEAPFYHAPSQSLVFASNGLVGLGGYDLYVTKGTIGGSFSAPENMGYPVNSVKDDIYYLSTDAKSVWKNAYLSSDRNSECCLDIFSFDRANVAKTISGLVVDCATGAGLSGASVQVKDAAGKVIYSGTTNASGRYEFKVDDYTALNTTATIYGYKDGAAAIAVPSNIEQESLSASNVCVTKIAREIEENKAIVLENVNYDYNSFVLSKGSYKQFEPLIKLMKENPNMRVQILGHTDNRGTDEYNQTLSEKRAQSCVNYLVSKGIAADRLEAIGKGESEPIADNEINGKDNPAGRAKNRRTEFKILNY